MALAQRMENYNRMVEGSAARALPREDRAVRPATKPAARPRKVARGPLVIGVAGWACVMAFSMALVHRNAQVQAETAAITQARADLARLELANRELANNLETQVSVGKVQEWANAHEMKRPALVNKLNGDPTAVAARPQPAQPQPPQPVAKAGPGFWATLKGYFTALSSGPTLTAENHR